MRLGLGLSISKSNYSLGNPSVIAHYNRVIADGGVLPAGLIGVAYVFNQLQTILGSSYLTLAQAAYNPHWLGYKLGTGSGNTLGQATQKLYAIGGSSYDVVQNTVGSQPLLLSRNSTDGNYYYNPCVASNSVTSGTALTYTAATDTLVITAKIFANNQTTASWDNIVVQNTLFGLQIQNNGTQKSFRVNATTAATGSTLYTPSSTAPHFIRATITTLNITYAWSADGITYTTLDSGITLPTFGTTGTLTIGGSANSTSNACSIYSVVLNNSTTSSTITFSPSSYAPATSQTSWTGGGATWTINTGTAATGLKGCLVNVTMIQTDGIAHNMVSSAFTSIGSRTMYTSFTLMYGAPTTFLYDDATSFNFNGAYKELTGSSRYFGTSSFMYVDMDMGVANNLRRIGTIQFESVTPKATIQTNNGTVTTSTGITFKNTSGVTLFSSRSNTGFGQFVLTNHFMTSQADDNTTKTNMYNLLTYLNNNAS